jgi:hypothetical protein
MRSINQKKSKETAISCPQVKNTMDILRNMGQQYCFSLSTMGKMIRTCKIG